MTTLPAAWAGQVARRPGAPCVHHRGGTLTFAQADRWADGVAGLLTGLGVRRGDRVGLRAQNDPEYLVGLLAVWRCEAVAVACSPMLTPRELTAQLEDAGATVLLAHDDPPAGDGVQVVDTAELGAVRQGPAFPAPRLPWPADLAVLTYTSGTTGPPKGAMTSHGNLAFAAAVYRDWVALGPDDVILGLAPLFHVTGLVAHLGATVLTGAPLVLDHRFDAARIAGLVEEHGCTFTVAAITAFRAVLADPATAGRELGSLRKAFTGGAPVPAATAEEWEARTGTLLHNVYGLTETTSATHAVPLGVRAPVHPGSGALSIGVAVPGTTARVVDDAGRTLGPGREGELAIRGPQVTSGYWRRPEETAHALPGGELRTGDIAVIDEQGWTYVVDRKKDLIVASGFKVWPRDVEDVLVRHPAVHEAAVVGVPDAYRGEAVRAYVALRAGAGPVSGPELVAFAREHLAGYKAPREVCVVDALPRTASGKLLRRALRDAGDRSRTNTR